MHRTRAGTADATGWYPAHSQAGRFSVAMPAPFNDFTITTKSEHGVSITIDAIGTQLADGVKLSVVCTRGGDRSPAAVLGDFAAKNGSVTHLTVSGHNALEMRSTDPVGVMRFVALNDQLCVLIVDPQGAKKVVPENMAKLMFQSFTPDP